MTETNLKPCPFCGGDDFFVSEWHDFVSVSCRKCGTEVGPLWNNRPIEDAQDKELTRLREALEEIKKTVEYAQTPVYSFCIDLDSKDGMYILDVTKEALEGKEE